jgi:hypothetical protein
MYLASTSNLGGISQNERQKSICKRGLQWRDQCKASVSRGGCLV